MSPGKGCVSTALAKAMPKPTTVYGFSLSHFNEGVNWSDVASKGYYFVTIKASQGLSYVDPEFTKLWEDAGNAGFIRSAYHFITGQARANSRPLSF